MQDSIEGKVVTTLSLQSDKISITDGADNRVGPISEIDALVTNILIAELYFDYIFERWSNLWDNDSIWDWLDGKRNNEWEFYLSFKGVNY